MSASIRYHRGMDDLAFYYCDSCGEEIALSLDPSGGASQQFVEDCPVCCRPMVIHVDFDSAGQATITAERE